MPAKNPSAPRRSFWSFALGVTLALVVCAGVFKVINDAPVPFVTKVQTVQNEGDELRALKDPNQPLYKEGQGTEQKYGGRRRHHHGGGYVGRPYDGPRGSGCR